MSQTDEVGELYYDASCNIRRADNGEHVATILCHGADREACAQLFTASPKLFKTLQDIATKQIDRITMIKLAQTALKDAAKI